jgi:NADPH-dependent 2,4-dienoyl-CoA reductase/sulfur reductase-like enzyme
MEKTDVLVIGGSAAGIVAATTAKSFNPDKSVMLVRKESIVMVPCGIPYIFGELKGKSDQNVIPDALLSKTGVTLKIAEVTTLETEKKICRTADGVEIGFDKLVLATGSTAIVPGWLPGTNLKNVFTIPKDKGYLDQFIIELKQIQKIIVIGGGFIGVEMADELCKSGKDVTLVELLPHVLSLAFDPEFTVMAEEILTRRGVKLRTGISVKAINGQDKVTGVTLKNDEVLAADAVILSVGYRPNSALAQQAGLQTNKMGHIPVNEYMRTENPDIFAVGDCAQKTSFITRTVKPTMLASTACAEARIAGTNLYKLSTVRMFGGTISIFCTCLGEDAFGAAGVTESLARERGLDIVTATFEGVDRHPGTLPGAHKTMIKLIVAKESGIILGGELMGGESVGELTNLIGFIIQNKMSVDALYTSQIGTHPLLTATPIMPPLIKAAEMVIKQRRNGK